MLLNSQQVGFWLHTGAAVCIGYIDGLPPHIIGVLEHVGIGREIVPRRRESLQRLS
jgi:hypothetical protein